MLLLFCFRKGATSGWLEIAEPGADRALYLASRAVKVSPTGPGPERGLSFKRGARLDSLDERFHCVETHCGDQGWVSFARKVGLRLKFSLQLPAEADRLSLCLYRWKRNEAGVPPSSRGGTQAEIERD